MKSFKLFGLLTAVFGAMALVPCAQGALVLDLQAAQFDAATGTWVDLSTSKNDAVAYNATYKLTLASAATPNGTAAVDFTGNSAATPTFLKLTNALNSASSSFTTNPNFTITFVLNFQALASNETLIGGDYVLPGSIQTTLGKGGAYWELQSSRGVEVSNWAKGTAYGWGVFTETYDGATAKMYYDGVLVSSKTISGVTFGVGATFIGGNLGGGSLTGQLAAFQVYDTALTSTEVAAENTALNAAYFQTVPEPSAWALWAGGVGMLVAGRRMRR